VVTLSAALKAIPRDLTEAAPIDGATELQIFRRVTVPLPWPTITVIATLTMIGVLKIFDLVYAMTSGGPAGEGTVLALRMYISERHFRLRQRHRGGAAHRGDTRYSA
jgi:alpha-glucoside transport system permease protein